MQVTCPENKSWLKSFVYNFSLRGPQFARRAYRVHRVAVFASRRANRRAVSRSPSDTNCALSRTDVAAKRPGWKEIKLLPADAGATAQKRAETLAQFKTVMGVK